MVVDDEERVSEKEFSECHRNPGVCPGRFIASPSIEPGASDDSRTFEEPRYHAVLLRQGQRFFCAGADRTATRTDVAAHHHRRAGGG